LPVVTMVIVSAAAPGGMPEPIATIAAKKPRNPNEINFMAFPQSHTAVPKTNQASRASRGPAPIAGSSGITDLANVSSPGSIGWKLSKNSSTPMSS
jgi:hypothetical protein